MNLHKGVSPLHRLSTVHGLRQKMRDCNPDLLFLQEVQQEHRGHAKRFSAWPASELTHFLSEDCWHAWHYGRNAQYQAGHHGNAILSKRPLNHGQNYDISAYRFEKRGLLHSSVQLEDAANLIHCFCVHLALFERGRERQLEQILRYIDTLANQGPTIVAGDFNDWRNRISSPMRAAGFQEVFEVMTGAPAKTFPSFKPMLPMDRIYVRGFKIHAATILHEEQMLSDHLGISAELELL
ncbi:endonuclease/exonuclease/phosphatase family protein [Polynucleobacter meluiroseus]|nr:endonuclease/exonuclease/phosphatase family protein [Polynucleobacter meluiroseus]